MENLKICLEVKTPNNLRESEMNTLLLAVNNLNILINEKFIRKGDQSAFNANLDIIKNTIDCLYFNNCSSEEE